jgi:hypothetical protein
MAAPEYASGLVYHEDIDLSFFIAGLGRTVTAMVGTSAWGPMNEPTRVFTEDLYKQQFGSPVVDSNSYMAARSYFQRGQELLVIRVGDGNEAQSDHTLTIGGGGTAPVIKAAHPGTFGDTIYITISAGTLGAGYYKITVDVGDATSGDEKGVIDNIPVATDTDLAALIAAVDLAGLIEAVNGTAGGTVTVPQARTALTGGNDGIATVDENDYIGTTGANKTGLKLLRSCDELPDVDLVVVPNYKSAGTPQALTSAVWTEMIDISTVRQDMVAVLDAPPDLTVDTDSGGGPYGVDQFWRGTSNHAETLNVNTSFAATYFSWVTIHDYFNGVDVSLPPGSAAAGAISYSDRVSYPWWAAAGLTRGTLAPLVKDTAYQPLDDEILTLQSDNTMGCVNPILVIDDSYYIMGQKTMLRSTSLLNRLNVRRLVNKIRKQLNAVLAQLQFQPNDERTWREFEELVKPYLDHLVTSRGLVSYDVQVGLNVSMTATDVEAGRLIGRIVLVLMPTGEKVIFDYVITDQDANFSELGAV